MGRTHAAAIRHLGDAASLVAVWGGSRAPELAKDFGVACESTWEAVVRRPDIDAVFVTTPHHLHVGEVMAALEAGKHVIVEKPMATTVADCDRILAEAKRKGLLIATAYSGRFRTNPPRARELVQSGALGRIQSMHFSMIRRLDDNFGTNKFIWMNMPENLGFVIDGLPHGVDMIRWFTGAEVVRVAGFCRTFVPDRVIEDTTVGLMELSNGATVSVHTTLAANAPHPREAARLNIVGSIGLIDMDMFGEMHFSDKQDGWRLVSTQPPVPFANPADAYTNVGRMQAYYDQIQSFIDGIHGKPMLAGSGVDGRAGVAACLAIMESSRDGRFVSVT